MNRSELADFLRSRREQLQPEEVGLSRGARRRTSGLRREEVAQLAGMSPDYVNRLEQGRAPQPSEQLLTALARALRLDDAERDHLFALAGHRPPARTAISDHVAPGLLRILDRLHDTPAEVLSRLGETLAQTPPARALLGDRTGWTGLARYNVYRWYLHPETRDVYVREDQPEHGRLFTAELRAVSSSDGDDPRVRELVGVLQRESGEFREVWAQHEVAAKHPRSKRFQHPEIGTLTLDCQTLVDTDTQQVLLVFTAAPGTEDAQKLDLLRVIGTQQLSIAQP